jgi:hypothetical protein
VRKVALYREDLEGRLPDVLLEILSHFFGDGDVVGHLQEDDGLLD